MDLTSGGLIMEIVSYQAFQKENQLKNSCDNTDLLPFCIY